MRRRRIDRCVLRAAVAIEAGVLDDALVAIEEVERLDPAEPAIEPLRARLAAAETSPMAAPFEPRPFEMRPADAVVLDRPLIESAVLGERAFPAPSAGTTRRSLPAAAAAVLIAISAVGGWVVFSRNTPPQLASVRNDTAAASEPPSPNTPPVTAAESPAVRVSETAITAPETPDPASEIPDSQPPTAAPAVPEATVSADRLADQSSRRASPLTPEAMRTSTRPTTDSPATGGMAPSAPQPAPSAGPSLDRRTLTATVDPSPPLPEPLPPATVPAVAVTEGVALPENTVPPAVPASNTTAPVSSPAAASAPSSQPSDENGVRAALNRYESAYTALDAAAASAVWPGVDRRALASAFQALSSQRVSLGRCDVRVTGVTAQAECRGTARWEPKVGAGPQSSPRQWRFDLRNTGSSWIITRATVR
jgi:hypothetical protein